VVSAAASYFGMVFGAGLLLGPIRVLLLVPHLGVRAAELLEDVVMCGVIVLAARWVAARHPAGLGAGRLLVVGMATVVTILAAELALGSLLRGQGAREVYLGKDPVSGAVYYALLALCAVLPWMLGRRIRQTRQPN
jgi:hypothetical protein